MKRKGVTALLALSIVAGAAQASIIYKWRTPDGVPHMGDDMPPEAAKYGYSLFDTNSGETINTVPPEQEHKQVAAATPPAAKITKADPEVHPVVQEQTKAAAPSPDKSKQRLEANQREIDGVMKQINGLTTAINMTPYHRAEKMAELQSQMDKLQMERLEMEPSAWDGSGRLNQSEAENRQNQGG